VRWPRFDPATGDFLDHPGCRLLLPPSVVPPLPEPTQEFLQTPEGERIREVVLALHRWMIFKRYELGQLTWGRIMRFVLRPARRDLRRKERRVYREQIQVYLRWLRARQLITFDPKFPCRPRRFGPRRPQGHYPLPELAHSFLDSLRPTLKPSTYGCYLGSVRRFHRWLDQERLVLRRLTRSQIELWMQLLHREKLAPATRMSVLYEIRTYLRWLEERGALTAYPDDLIRRKDMPKLPVYLPRPLAPEIDRQLQHRLLQSDEPYAQGLLLMRRSGLRVGELLRLEYQCLRTDGQDHWYLKVPLGKLDTERLVPLDGDTVALVERLQASGVPDRPLLLASPAAAKGSYPQCCDVLRAMTADLHDAAPITTHRLRHTYATELLNAGMSLVGIMRLLGHHDYRMTLRYAAITHETIGKEYYQAIDRLTEKYRLPPRSDPAAPPDPHKTLDDLARWVRRQLPSGAELHALLNRITRLQHDLVALSHDPFASTE